MNRRPETFASIPRNHRPFPSWGAGFFLGFVLLVSAGAQTPNVVLIMTDDQGYGDLGVHGNPIIKTPNLDAFTRQSVRVDPFYVCPVCAPTRASLMTGRYNYRTGVVDTYLGRAMMRPDEVTLAEMLRGAGYRTGIFGKWHLGDNYPLRAMDQGFEESLLHKGGGIKQSSDPPGGSSYFDPVLYRNGIEIETRGYCSDIFTDGAIDFIERAAGRPFFVYLSYNAPHTPLQVPDRYADPYRALDMKPADFPDLGRGIEGRFDAETTARIYGMITNIDDNLGRLFAKIDDLGLTENTIVIFLTDNGPQQPRYVGGLRARKGSVHEGGIRVPFYIRWPAKLEAGRKVETPAAHIDVVPTLLEACGVDRPGGVTFDGRSILPLLRGESPLWPDRTLYFQWHRGDAPDLHRAFAARGPRYKLVQPVGVQPAQAFDGAAPMLFDLVNDPYERTDLAGDNPDVVEKMLAGYRAWFRDVGSARGYAPVRIVVGSPSENPVMLSRQDRRGPPPGSDDDALGGWEITVGAEGFYDVSLWFPQSRAGGRAELNLSGLTHSQTISSRQSYCRFERIPLQTAELRLQAYVTIGESRTGANYVEIERVE